MSTQPIGLDSVLSRIDQIRADQQQLLDPSLVAASSSSSASSASVTGAATSASGSSSASASDFASLLAALQTEDASDSDAIGSDAPSASDGSGLDPSLDPEDGSSVNVPVAVSQMTDEANSLLGKPYLWGGGHSGWGAQSGYDCSGFVSAVLHAGGYLSSPQDSSTLASAGGMESGPGQYVTVYDRTDGYDGQAGHVIIDVNGQFYESGGQHGAWGGGGGVEKISRPSAQYLASFDHVLHPSGL